MLNVISYYYVSENSLTATVSQKATQEQEHERRRCFVEAEEWKNGMEIVALQVTLKLLFVEINGGIWCCRLNYFERASSPISIESGALERVIWSSGFLKNLQTLLKLEN